mgnify:CR=1 FL=1
MSNVLEEKFRERFLYIPIVDKISNYINMRDLHWAWCVDKATPYVAFGTHGAYGEYICDLSPIHANGLCLSKGGYQQIRGACEAFSVRWFFDDSLPRIRREVYKYTPPIISIYPFPLGEEIYVHHAVCQILHQHIEFRDDLSDSLRAELIEKFRALIEK